ncbi:MAG TPA: hypothetical protein VN253_08330 [Kofleriaceae bacterium]|nr:hypothetical protein [Kofleriaceae bacterium]
MKKIAFVFIAALAVLSFGTGCKKKGGVAEAMAKMESFKGDMCKCKDKACVEGVEAAMKKYGEENKDKMDANAKPSEADQKKMMGMMEEMSKCRATAMGPADGGSAAAAPPAAPPAGDDKGAAAAAPAPAGEEKKDDKAAAPPAGEEKKDDKK